MDQRTQEIFDRIIAKDINDITETDKEFIRARASYLDRHNRRKFEGVLGEEPATRTEPTEETTQPTTQTNLNTFPGENQEDDDEVVE